MKYNFSYIDSLDSVHISNVLQWTSQLFSEVNIKIHKSLQPCKLQIAVNHLYAMSRSDVSSLFTCVA